MGGGTLGAVVNLPSSLLAGSVWPLLHPVSPHIISKQPSTAGTIFLVMYLLPIHKVYKILPLSITRIVPIGAKIDIPYYSTIYILVK
jgi:hypothetical protein